MEILFKKFKDVLIKHPSYSGFVCGYDESRFILAVETNDDRKFFRKLRKGDGVYILDKYKDVKYRYIYENESEIEKQMKNESKGSISTL
jgi:hypothetical protein